MELRRIFCLSFSLLTAGHYSMLSAMAANNQPSGAGRSGTIRSSAPKSNSGAIEAQNPAARKTSAPKCPQYIDTVKILIERNWFPAAGPKSRAAVMFRITKEGRIHWMELDDASSHTAVNHSAEDAILTLGNLPPLPPGIDALDLCVEFNSDVPDSSLEYYVRPTPEKWKAAKALIDESERLAEQKSYAEAIAKLEQAQELTPFSAKIRDALFNLYLSAAKSTVDDNKKSSFLHKAVLLDPHDSRAKSELASYWKAHSKDYDNDREVLALAREYAANNQPIDALAEYCRVWSLNPDKDLIPEINKACLVREAYKSVLKWESIVARSKTAENLNALGKAYETCGDGERAKSCFEQASKMDRTNIVAISKPKVKPVVEEEEDLDEEDLGLPSKKAVAAPAGSDADNDEDSEAAIDNTRLASTTVSDTATAPLMAPESRLHDAFPLAPKGQCSVAVAVVPDRQRVVDYFDGACMGHSVHRWTPGRFPLRLFVENGANVPGYRPSFNQMVVDAFAAWAEGSGKRLSFVVVNDPRGANVTCSWTNDPGKMRIANAQGVTYFEFLQAAKGNNTISGAKITILTVFRHNKAALSDSAMRSVILHEIGHALGIAGHSPNKNDIMYPSMDPYGHYPTALSAADKATLKHLYQGYEHPAPTVWRPHAQGSGMTEN